MAKKHSALLMRTYVILVFCFMYLPIAVMIAFSFNESKSRSNFTGFTLGWYKSLFHNEMILSALGLSLVLALVSSIIATVLGTLATLGINSMSRKSQLIINNISYVPVVNPEIITGVSLMLLFVMAQNFGIGGESGIFGWPTLLIAHITFNIPYVIFNVGASSIPACTMQRWIWAAHRARLSPKSSCRSCPRPFCRHSSSA